MSEITVLGSSEGFAGTDFLSLVPLVAPKAVKSTAAPIKLSPSVTPSGGFFSNLVRGIGNVGGWFNQNSQNVVQVLDAAGRLRAGAKAQAAQVNDAYVENIINTPRQSWFDEEMVPGMKNSMLLLLAAVAVGGVVLMNRKASARVQP